MKESCRRVVKDSQEHDVGLMARDCGCIDAWSCGECHWLTNLVAAGFDASSRLRGSHRVDIAPFRSH